MTIKRLLGTLWALSAGDDLYADAARAIEELQDEVHAFEERLWEAEGIIENAGQDRWEEL